MATLEAKRGGRTKAITPVGLFNYSNHFLQQLSAFTRSEVGDPSTSRLGGRRSPGGGRVAVGREGFS